MKSSYSTGPSKPKLRDATLDEIDDELARRSLIDFTLRTKPSYRAGWFHRGVAAALDQFLEDVLEKRSPRLILTAPPQFGKSELTSRRFPAFAFGKNPSLHIVGIAYSADLAQSFSRDTQRIIDTPEYSAIFPATRILAENAKSNRYKRSAEEFHIVASDGGTYRAVGRTGGIPGRPANVVIVDDLLKDFDEAMSETIRESCWNIVATAALPRLQEGGGAIVMQTRWHMDDVIGRLQDREKGRWKVLNFPALAEVDEPHRKIGEPLSVERFSLETLLSIRDGGVINSYQWAALYQQRPSPAGGGVFKRDDWRFYDPDSIEDGDFEELVQSWDCTFKKTSDSDFVAGHVWGRLGARKYLVDRVNARMTFGETKAAIRTLSAKHPKAHKKFIEDKANGSAIIDDLKLEISGMIPVEPEGGKVARAHAVSGDVEAHNVYLPGKKNAQGVFVPLGWVHDFIEQHASFPSGAHDDDVDAMSQALSQIRKRKIVVMA